MNINRNMIEVFVKYVMELHRNEGLKFNSTTTTFSTDDSHEIIMYATVDGYNNVTITTNKKSLTDGTETLVGKFKITANSAALGNVNELAHMAAENILIDKNN